MAPAISGPGFQDQVERSLLGKAPVGEAGLGEDIGEPGLVQEQSKKWCRMEVCRNVAKARPHPRAPQVGLNCGWRLAPRQRYGADHVATEHRGRPPMG